MNAPSSPLSFDQLVEQYYERLFCFALRLSGCYDQAADLTQQTFYLALSRQHQLANPAKVRSWLFKILLREYLQGRRRRIRFPHHELDETAHHLPRVTDRHAERIDGRRLMETLQELDDHHRIPLVLFYVADLSYAEIAQVLELPIGTVMSRLHRGKAMLRRHVEDGATARTAPAPDKGRWKQSVIEFVNRVMDAHLTPQTA
jgi:RNA polymerase sigma-70 factor, ECF subfamily